MKINIALALTALIGSQAAWPQPAADTDGDGAVTLAELQEARRQVTERQFAELDSNGDGVLTQDEMRVRRAGGGRSSGMHARALDRLDTDGDDAISLAELQAMRPEATGERFAALDGNGDGLLTRDELQRLPRQMRGMRQDMAARIDTDGDGAWSLAELQAVRPELDVERFNSLDDNGDGLIGEDEQPMRRRGGPRR